MKLSTSWFRAVTLVAAFFGVQAVSAEWGYDSVAKTLSDGNWTLSVTVSGNNLTVTGATAGSGNLDLSDVGDLGGKTVVAVGDSRGTPGFNNAGLTAVKLPDTVTALHVGAFSGCTDLVSVDMPGLLTISKEAFKNCSSLTSVEFPNVTKFDRDVFVGCANLASVSFPSIVTFGELVRYHGAFGGLTNLTHVTVGNDIRTIGHDTFSGCTSLRVFEPSDCLPNLTTIGDAAFQNALKNAEQFPTNLPSLTSLGGNAFEGCAMPEFNLPELTSIGGSAFKSAKLKRIYAPNLVKIKGNAFQDSLLEGDFVGTSVQSIENSAFQNTKLESVHFSQALTSVGLSFRGCNDLKWFEPLFPTNLTSTLGGWEVYSSCVLTNNEVIYNFPAKPAVPSKLCEKPNNISSVIFYSDVTSIGASAFPLLRPQARVVFHGPSVPTLESKALFYDGEANNDRIVIAFDHPDARSAWLSAVAPYATEYQASYLDKPDYPGENTLGILKIGEKTVNRQPVNIYAWVVDEAPVSENGTLVVHGLPDERVEVSPAYGLHNDRAIGSTTVCTAPAMYIDEDYKATLAGFVVSNLNEFGVYSFVASGTTNTYSYVQGTGIGDLTWFWTNHHWRVLGQSQGGGTVEPADSWVPAGETVTLTPLPSSGMVFRYWTGDIGAVDRHQAPLTLTADQARTVTAVFGTSEAAQMSWHYTATDATNKRGKLFEVSADGQDTRWSFYVSGETDELQIGDGNNMYESGGGVLDLRNVTEEAGVVLRAVYLGNQYVGSTMPHDTVTAIYLPESVTTIGDFAFNGLSNLETVSLPGVQNLATRVFTNCSKLRSVELPSIVNMNGAMYSPTFGGCTSLTNLYLGADLEVVGNYALADLPQIGWLGRRTFPRLRSVGMYGMGSLGSSCADPQLPTNFPALTSADTIAFQNAAFRELTCGVLETLSSRLFEGSQIESFYGPSVRSVGDRALQVGSFTNAVFSQALTNLYFVESHEWLGPLGTNLRHFEPFLPTNLTCRLNSFTFGNSKMDATTNLIWNIAGREVVPAGLFQYMTNLQHVVFMNNVTSIQQNALSKLPPKACVEFHGADMPVLGSKALYRDGEDDDTRIVIEVYDKAALPAWAEATAENDEIFRTEYLRRKPDYPGAGTFGLLTLGTKTVNKKTVGIYAWVKAGYPRRLLFIIQ